MSDKSWRWIWQPGQGEGAEYFIFRPTPGGFEARGKVIATLEGAPLNATYVVDINATWLTRRVRVDVQGGAQLDILSDGAGSWRRADGRALPELDGCIDTDILVTPFTNTLPIRRLGLKAGQAAGSRSPMSPCPRSRCTPRRSATHAWPTRTGASKASRPISPPT